MKLFRGDPQRALTKARPETVTKIAPNASIELKSIPFFSYPLQLFFDAAREGRSTDPIGSARNAFAVYSLIYACMKFRATKFAEPPLWIREEDDEGNEEWVKGTHPLEEILEYPNNDMEMSDLLTLVSYYLDSTGACLLVVDKNLLGDYGGFYPFARDEFSVEPYNGQLFGRFGVQTLTGFEWKYADQVIYLREPDPRNIYQVFSPCDAALAHANLGSNLVRSIKAALRNAVRPGGIVTVKGELSPEAFERMRQEIKVNYAGVYGTGETVLFEGGAKFFEAKGGTLKDLSLGEVNKDVEANICSAFGVHPALVSSRLGVENSSSFDTLLDKALDLFYDTVVQPRWTTTEKCLTRRLLRPIDKNTRRFIRFDTSDVRALQDDMGAKTTEAMSASSYWTLNEQRSHTGKPPLPNGEGDQLASDRAADRAQELAETQARTAEAQASSFGDSEDEPKLKKAIEDLFPQKKVATVFLGESIRRLTKEQLDDAWGLFDTKAKKDESAYETEAMEQFAYERGSVATLIENAMPNRKDDDDPPITSSVVDPYIQAAELRIAAAYGPNGTYYKQWLTRYRRLVEKTMRIGAKDLVGQLGISFSVTNPRVQRAIQLRVTKLAGNVSETTKNRIRDEISIARAEGVGVRELAKRIREKALGIDISKSRATTIARTETVGALNEGEMVAAKESGVFQSKRWLSQRVGDARENHIEEEDKGFVAIDKPYPVTHKQHPHDGIGGAAEDVNCRCSQIFSDLPPNEANDEEGL